jgi:hypothetical protein
MNRRDRVKMARSDPKRYDYMYARVSKYSGYDAMGVISNGYPRYSVLAGQDMICFVDNFRSIEALDKAFPGLSDNFRGLFTEPTNHFNHLPDEGDF